MDLALCKHHAQSRSGYFSRLAFVNASLWRGATHRVRSSGEMWWYIPCNKTGCCPPFLGPPTGENIVSNTTPHQNLTHSELYFEPVRELVLALDALQQDLTRDPQPGHNLAPNQTHLLMSIETFGHRYEIVVWDVLMPHLIRNAPKLAPETVTALQDNHQIEKQLFDVLKLHSNAHGMNDEGSQSRVLASVNRLAGVLRGTLRLLECEVLVAVDSLPEEQKAALTAVVEHELMRVDSGTSASPPGVSRAMDVLDTEHQTPPVLRVPHVTT